MREKGEDTGAGWMSGDVQTSLRLPFASQVFSSRLVRLAILGCKAGTAFAETEAVRIARVMMVKCMLNVEAVE